MPQPATRLSLEKRVTVKLGVAINDGDHRLVYRYVNLSDHGSFDQSGRLYDSLKLSAIQCRTASDLFPSPTILKQYKVVPSYTDIEGDNILILTGNDLKHACAMFATKAGTGGNKPVIKIVGKVVIRSKFNPATDLIRPVTTNFTETQAAATAKEHESGGVDGSFSSPPPPHYRQVHVQKLVDTVIRSIGPAINNFRDMLLAAMEEDDGDNNIIAPRNVASTATASKEIEVTSQARSTAINVAPKVVSTTTVASSEKETTASTNEPATSCGGSAAAEEVKPEAISSSQKTYQTPSCSFFQAVDAAKMTTGSSLVNGENQGNRSEQEKEAEEDWEPFDKQLNTSGMKEGEEEELKVLLPLLVEENQAGHDGSWNEVMMTADEKEAVRDFGDNWR